MLIILLLKIIVGQLVCYRENIFDIKSVRILTGFTAESDTSAERISGKSPGFANIIITAPARAITQYELSFIFPILILGMNITKAIIARQVTAKINASIKFLPPPVILV